MIPACSKRMLGTLFSVYEHKVNNPIELLKAIMLELYSYKASPDELSRELICGCVRAWYGHPAPIVIAVEGSPPKGVIIFPNGFKEPPIILFYSSAMDVACRIDSFYHKHLFNKLLALIVYAIRELCNECFDSDVIKNFGETKSSPSS